VSCAIAELALAYSIAAIHRDEPNRRHTTNARFFHRQSIKPPGETRTLRYLEYEYGLRYKTMSRSWE